MRDSAQFRADQKLAMHCAVQTVPTLVFSLGLAYGMTLGIQVQLYSNVQQKLICNTTVQHITHHESTHHATTPRTQKSKCHDSMHAIGIETYSPRIAGVRRGRGRVRLVFSSALSSQMTAQLQAMHAMSMTSSQTQSSISSRVQN